MEKFKKFLKYAVLGIALLPIFGIPLTARAAASPPALGGTGTSTLPSLGSVLVGTGQTQYGPLPVGSDGLCLVASSTSPFGVAWSSCVGSAGLVLSVTSTNQIIPSATTGANIGFRFATTSISQFVNDSGYTTSTVTIGTSTGLNTFTVASSGNKSFTITIPSNVGFFTNDSGYLPGSGNLAGLTNTSTARTNIGLNNTNQNCAGGSYVSSLSATTTIGCTALPSGNATTVINGVNGPSFTFSLASSSNAFSITTSSGNVVINLPNNVGAFTNDKGYITTSTFNATGTAFNFPYWNAAGTGLAPTSTIVQSSTEILVGNFGASTGQLANTVFEASGTNVAVDVNNGAFHIRNFGSTTGGAGTASDANITVNNNGLGISAPSNSNGRIIWSLANGAETFRMQSNGDFGIGSNNATQRVEIGNQDNGSGVDTTKNFAVDLDNAAQPTLISTSTSGGNIASGTYFYRISASDGVGNSLDGLELGNVTVLGVGSSSITIGYTATQGAAYYNIYRATGTASTYPANSFVGSTTAITFTDTVLNPSAGTNNPNTVSGYVNKLSSNGNSWIDGGNVGIGTAIPGALLDLGTGDVRIPNGRLNLANTTDQFEYLYSVPNSGSDFLGARNQLVLQADNDGNGNGSINFTIGSNLSSTITGIKASIINSGAFWDSVSISAGTSTTSTAALLVNGSTTLGVGDASGNALINIPASAGLIITGNQTGVIRLIPSGNDIFLQNQNSSGNMIFSGQNANNLTGNFLFKGTGSALFLGAINGSSSLTIAGTSTFAQTSTFQGNISTTLSNTFVYANGQGILVATTTPAGGTLNGNGTSTQIPYYGTATSFLSNASFTYNSSTAVFTAPTGTFTGTLTVQGNVSTTIANALIVGTSTGVLVAYPGSSCSGGQFATSISATGTITCSTPSGSGNVSSATTTVNNNFPFWSGSNQLSATSTLTQSAGNLNLAGNINVAGNVTTTNETVSSTLNFPLVNASGTQSYTLKNDTSGFLEVNATGVIPGSGGSTTQPWNIILQNANYNTSTNNQAEATISQSLNFADGSRTFIDHTVENYPGFQGWGEFLTATGATGSSSSMYPYFIEFTDKSGNHAQPFSVGPVNSSTNSSGYNFAINNLGGETDMTGFLFQSGAFLQSGGTASFKGTGVAVSTTLQVSQTSTFNGNITVAATTGTSTASVGTSGSTGCVKTEDQGGSGVSYSVTVSGIFYTGTTQCN